MAKEEETPNAPLDQPGGWTLPMVPALMLAIIAIAAFFWITSQRALHPFELEWMEGGSLQHLARVAAGQALYAAPSIEFVPYPYPPFYYYAALPFAAFTGVDFFALRAVSLVSTLATCATLYAWVRRETTRSEIAIVCVGLFLATYRISGAYMDVGRIDSLFVALVIIGGYLLRVREDTLGLALAAVFVFLATLTKQTGLAVFAPLVVWSVYRDWAGARNCAGAAIEHARFRRSIVFAGTSAVLIALGTVLLTRGANTHFMYYILGAQTGHEIRWSMVPYFFWNDLFLSVPLAVVATAAWVRSSKDRIAVLFYMAFLSGIVVACMVPRLKVGGAMNNLIPLHAVLVLLAGVSLGQLLNTHRKRAWLTPLVGLCLFAQLVWLGFDPRIALPRSGDQAAGERFVRQLETVDGEILMPAHGYLAGLAGKRVYAHQMPVDDLANSTVANTDALREEFESAIAEQRFALIVDSASRFLEEYPNSEVLKRHYRVKGQVFEDASDLIPRSGWQLGPGRVWVPRRAQ